MNRYAIIPPPAYSSRNRRRHTRLKRCAVAGLAAALVILAGLAASWAACWLVSAR